MTLCDIVIFVSSRNSALEALINFAYNGHIAIDQQNVQALLIGASFLQLQNVKDACCSFLQQRYRLQTTNPFICVYISKIKSQFMKHQCIVGVIRLKVRLFIYRLHPKNCLGVRQFAETMMCTTLYDVANSFVHQHFVEVSMSEEFLALRPEEVLEIVGCDELNIQAEEQVSVEHLVSLTHLGFAIDHIDMRRHGFVVVGV